MTKPHTQPSEIQNVITMPHSLDVEQAFLAGLLYDNTKYYDVFEIVKAEHFYNSLNSKVYVAIGKLINSGKEASALTLVDFMANDKALVDMNGVEFLVELSQCLISTSNLVSYAEQIRDFYIRRALIEFHREGIFQAERPSVDISTLELKKEAEEKIFALGSYLEQSEQVSNAPSLMAETLKSVEEAYKQKELGQIPFLNTGIMELDRIIGGMRPQNLIVVGACTGSGKTAFAITVMMNLAKQGKSIFFASLEMSKSEIGERLLSQQSGQTAFCIGNGTLGLRGINDCIEAGKHISLFNLYVDTTPGLSLASLRSKAMKLQRNAGLDFIVVDYLQLMESNNQKDNSLERVSKISRGLKALAKEMNAPLLALAQFSREPNKRGKGSPKLSDFRESGTIEQDADVALLLYREFDFLKSEEPPKNTMEHEEWQGKMNAARNFIDIDIAKNRRGCTEKITVFFDPKTMRFGD